MTNWREAAACRGMDPDLFMPYQGREDGWQKNARARAARAREVCGKCPVRTPCRGIVRTATAVKSIGLEGNTNAHVGIFAGETYADRRKAIKT